ncbi:phosphoribosyltransferase family protein [Viridibacillus arvi]|uniref:phosphoribosyltransferase family protein n=1 Tax=Viridibacillus arvi TaxID=263475 RepID=UPI0036746D91
MTNTYTLQVAGLKRDLPIIRLTENLSIASFVILGDAELLREATPLLVDKLPEVDVIVTAEAKGIPLAYEVTNQLGLTAYYVARKTVKPYMQNPLINEVHSITTQAKQTLCFDQKDAQAIKGKRVAIIDDVISTGESLRALEELVELAGGNVVAKAAILAEGDAAKRKDIIFLEELPLFD